MQWKAILYVVPCYLNETCWDYAVEMANNYQKFTEKTERYEMESDLKRSAPYTKPLISDKKPSEA